MVPQLFDDILEGARRIQRIVEELRSYARPQEAILDEQVDVNEVVRSVIVLSKAFIYRRTQNFSARYGDHLPSIRGSAQRIGQVVINLIQNACEALQDNQEKVSITTSYDEERKIVVIAGDWALLQQISQSDISQVVMVILPSSCPSFESQLSMVFPQSSFHLLEYVFFLIG